MMKVGVRTGVRIEISDKLNRLCAPFVLLVGYQRIQINKRGIKIHRIFLAG